LIRLTVFFLIVKNVPDRRPPSRSPSLHHLCSNEVGRPCIVPLRAGLLCTPTLRPAMTVCSGSCVVSTPSTACSSPSKFCAASWPRSGLEPRYSPSVSVSLSAAIQHCPRFSFVSFKSSTQGLKRSLPILIKSEPAA
jgi:hypothetical protein